jgi:hypothetical protein
MRVRFRASFMSRRRIGLSALTQMTQGDLGGDRGDRALGDVEVDPAAGGLRIDNVGSMSG